MKKLTTTSFTFCIEAISSFALAFLLIYFYKPKRFCLHLCKCIWKMSTMHLLTSQRVYVYWLYTYTNERGKHCKNFPQNVTLLVQCLFYINPLIAKHDPCHTPVPKRWQLILRNKTCIHGIAKVKKRFTWSVKHVLPQSPLLHINKPQWKKFLKGGGAILK